MLDKKNEDLILLEKEIKVSYMCYALSSLNRSLPSVLDGLKCVQRRILYYMWIHGHRATDKFRKSSYVVGGVMGLFHPHGDTSIYLAIVRMTRDFVSPIPIIEGQGNFGSIDGDPPAAVRYTEIKLSRFAITLLEEIHQETIEFKSNYDGSFKEPMNLVNQIPYILLPGIQGISVGYTSNIPSHNLGEVIDSTIHLIDNPDATLENVLKFLKGPDFATGGIICNQQNLYKIYETGEGFIHLKGKIEFEGENRIVITEIPFQVQKINLIDEITELVKNNYLEEIQSIRDESGKYIRIVLEIKKKTCKELVINKLMKRTSFSINSKFNFLALNEEGVPQLFPLLTILKNFILFRHKILIKKYTFELKKSEKQLIQLFAYVIVLDNLNYILQQVVDSNNTEELRNLLLNNSWSSSTMKKYEKYYSSEDSKWKFTESQVENILNFKISKFTKMEIAKIEENILEEIENLNKYKKIIDSKDERNLIIKEQLYSIKKSFSKERKTQIIEDQITVEDEDLIPVEDVIIILSHQGFLKRVSLDAYREQKRGGKGSFGLSNKENDFALQILSTNTHEMLLFFTEKGKVYNLKAYVISSSNSKTTTGRYVLHYLSLDKDDKIIKILPINSQEDYPYILFATNCGTIRKNSREDFSDLRKNGKIYMKFKDPKTKIIDVVYSKEEGEIMLFTKFGKAIYFDNNKVRKCNSRNSLGVRGCLLQEGDEVISMINLEKEEKDKKIILTITKKGLGKNTLPSEYRKTNRGTKGVTNIKISENNEVINVLCINNFKEDDLCDNLIMITFQGKVLNFSLNQIRVTHRNTKGVKLINLDKNDYIVSCSKN